MKYFLGILFFIMTNLNCFADEYPQYGILILNEVQSNSTIAAIEYYKDNYSSKVYGLSAMENESSIIFTFKQEPSPIGIQKGGGSRIVKLIYSKKLSKIIDAKVTHQR